MSNDTINEEKQSDVVEPNVSAKPDAEPSPKKKGKKAKAEKKDGQTGKPPRKPAGPSYGTEALQKKSVESLDQAAASTDPQLALEAEAVRKWFVALPQAAAAIFRAQAALDTAEVSLEAARVDMRAELARVGGVLKATERGREYYRSSKGDEPWLTAQNLISGVASSGIEVPDTWMTELGVHLASAKATADAEATARQARNDARASFWTTLPAAKKALSLLRASLRYRGLSGSSASPTGTGGTTATPPPTIAGTPGGPQAV